MTKSSPRPHSRARRQGLADLLARSAVRTPDKTAIVFGQLRQSFADLDALVSRTAAGLAERGVAKGDRVVLLARNSHGFVAAYFALARIGAVSVPVNCGGDDRLRERHRLGALHEGQVRRSGASLPAEVRVPFDAERQLRGPPRVLRMNPDVQYLRSVGVVRLQIQSPRLDGDHRVDVRAVDPANGHCEPCAFSVASTLNWWSSDATEAAQ
ncbi:AMP-binding protein [Streptomycetaceae bacterium NBC_01309]